jgi:hypothetical protein
MKDTKLKQLFAAARNEAAPPPSPGFADDVLRAVRREPAGRTADAGSLFEQLNVLFPRMAFAAVAVIILCVALDFGVTSAGLLELGDGTAQLSSQFDTNGGEP